MGNTNHSDLSFITNEENQNLSQRFQTLIEDTRFFDVLVGYFYLSGFHLVYKSLERTEKIRILIGIDTDKYTHDLLSKSTHKKFMEESIKDEMAKSEDNVEVEEGIKKFLEWLSTGKLEIKTYVKSNIHAKLYIMTFDEDDRDIGRVITGSSNFSRSGLQDNIEFNVELKGRSDYEFAKNKFEELWNSGDSYDVRDIINDYVLNKTWLREGITPYQLYLKFLYEYFKEDLSDTDAIASDCLPDGYESYDYQKEAVLNANRILKEYGGVFIADVVGLGKTFTVSLLLQHNNVRNKVLVIAPPTLVDEKNPGSWNNVLREFGIAAKFVSFGKLDSLSDEDQKYDYVVIDEAHRFRNDDTETYAKVSNICRGKKVILVSATPVNNSPRDIFNLIKLFQPPRNSSIPNISNLEKFFNALEANLKKVDRKKDHENYLAIFKQNAKEIREKVLKYILVRRTRTEIEKYYQVDMEKVGLNFPKVNDPKAIFYQLNEEESKTFNRSIDIITHGITYARYQPAEYSDGSNSVLNAMKQSQINLVGIMRTMLVKRLESSFYAFKKSIDRFIMFHESFLKAIGEGYVYSSKKYSVDLFHAIAEGDDFTIDKLVAEDKANKFSIELFTPKLRQDVVKDIARLKELRDMWSNINRDPKIIKLKEMLKNDKKLKGKVILFTESKETAEYIKQEIEELYKDKILLFTGSSKKSVRQKVIDNFDANVKKEKQKDEYRILISTEVLSEGVNLHRSNVIINYDIPWNPTRLMQRAGRINRINTKFEDISIFTFFPSDEGNDEIKLKEAAIVKIALFIDTLGADAHTLTDGEMIQSHELFNKLTSKSALTGEDEEMQSELKYFSVIKEIRDNDEALYEEILQLPQKARTARKHEEVDNTLLTYFRKNKNIQKFFLAQDSTSKELDFTEAASLLDTESSTKAVKLPSDFYTKLALNRGQFKLETYDNNKGLGLDDTSKRNSNEKKLSESIKSVLGVVKLQADKDYIIEVKNTLSAGLLPRAVVKQAKQSLEKVINEQGSSNPKALVQALRDNIPQNLINSNEDVDNVSETDEEVILSEYLISC